MRLTTAFVLAQAALSAAIVVPQFDGDIGELSFSRIVRLDCVGCPGEGRNHLLFDFNLPALNPTTMTLNSKPIFPMSYDHSNIDPASLALKAPLIPESTTTEEYLYNPDAFEKVDIGYSLLATVSRRVFPTPSKVHSLELSVLSVNNEAVSIDGVSVDVAEDLETGNLVFGDAHIMSVSEQCGSNIRCLLSKMMTKLRTSAQNFKSRLPGCGHHPHPSTPGSEMGIPVEPANPPMSLPGSEALKDIPFEPSPYHVPHPAEHAPGTIPARPQNTLLERAFQQVLMPIFIGLCAGIFFGIFVLSVVHGVCAIGRVIRRRRAAREGCSGRRRRCRFARRFGRKEGNAEEKEGLVASDGLKEDVESPPAYTDAEVEEGLEVVEDRKD